MCNCARRCGCRYIKGHPYRHHDYSCEDQKRKRGSEPKRCSRRKGTPKHSRKKSRKNIRDRKKSKLEIKLEKRNKYLENQLIHFHLQTYLSNKKCAAYEGHRQGWTASSSCDYSVCNEHSKECSGCSDTFCKNYIVQCKCGSWNCYECIYGDKCEICIEKNRINYNYLIKEFIYNKIPLTKDICNIIEKYVEKWM